MRILEGASVVLLSIQSLFYNSNWDLEYCLSLILYPAHMVVTKGLRFAGPLFVGLVIAGISLVVFNWYVFLLPELLSRYSWWRILCHFAFSHWLLINILFHYWRAWKTKPGYPPYIRNAGNLRQDWKWCKKCAQPKPPRTHHCTICERCVLKMDHHCPWLNNCVGHNNHRYFWMFCLYMWGGVMYVATTSAFIAVDFAGSDRLFRTASFFFGEAVGKASIKVASYKVDDHWLIILHRQWSFFFIIAVLLLCCGVVLALGSLLCFHTWIISQGMTSVERIVNKSEAKRLAKQNKFFVNKYDFGFCNNWRFFLAAVNRRSWQHFLLPSSHPPIGDGVHWDYTDYLVKSRQNHLHAV